MKPRKPLRPVSKKRQVWMREYAKAKEVADDLQKCPVCEKTSFKHMMDPHHLSGRGSLEDMLNFIWVCRPCHNRIHENGKWARANGYLE